MQGPKVNICMRLQLILVVHIYRMVLDYMQTQRLILVSLVEWVVLAVQKSYILNTALQAEKYFSKTGE